MLIVCPMYIDEIEVFPNAVEACLVKSERDDTSIQ